MSRITPSCLWQLIIVLLLGFPQTSMAGRGPGKTTAGKSKPMKVVTKSGKNLDLYKGSYALLIGVSDYKNWPNLPGAKQDVEIVGSLLSETGFHTTTVLNPDLREMEEAFKNFINQHGRGKDNRLLFYFAGHGYTVRPEYGGDSLGYIVPREAPNPNRDLAGFKSAALSMQRIEEYALTLDSKHALFLFDSCFSGSLFALNRAIPGDITYKTVQPVRQFITAGQADEKVPDDSLFRKMVVAALKGEGDMDRDGYMTGTELGQFLQKKVINYSKGSQHPQYGKIRNPYLDKGDFVFMSLNTISRSSSGSSSLSEIESQSEPIELPPQSGAAPDILKTPKSKKAAKQKGDNRQRKHEDQRAKQEGNTGSSSATSAPVSETPGQTWYDSDHGMKFVYIAPGSFDMGSENGFDDEKPVHRVNITEWFYLQTTEVTQGQWRSVMGDDPPELHFKDCGDDCPVERVSWNDVQEFFARLNQHNQGSNYKFSLPTEAQWEYACRAGSSTRYSFGDNESELGNYAWYRKNSEMTTHPVAQKLPNAWGLYDMHGNVWEWCLDRYDKGYYALSNINDPEGAVRGTFRVLRGGSWNFKPGFVRSAYRYWFKPVVRNYLIGFRCSRSLK
ncbi:MAG: SUMF1/EgtB/PvdO family nonheme iron enzyme [bacterium]